ncbi:MAG TPA: hypothetical protein P5512_09570 [Chitinophagales bacterium]|mgnify:CR=1 FL=1|nr:hypothetical protein [Chitinophagales bacterium]HRX24374.1 hypothetical protein [Chitinophagales bacterium]
MKRNLLALVFVSICIAGNSQNSVTLDINNISLTQVYPGSIGYSYVSYPSLFIAPTGSGRSPMIGAFYWFRGIDIYDQNRVYAANYWNISDQFVGPSHNQFLDPESEAAFYSLYNKNWYIHRATIDSFIERRGEPDYVIPEPILNWPGNGNPELGTAERLAPFADANGDGYYDPYTGDYPLIKGDAAIFQIMNADIDSESDYYRRMGIEMHSMFYAYEADDQSVLGNCIFVHNTIINRSWFDYKEFQTGLYIDFELGAYIDDFTGCDSALSLTYVYNGDSIDGPDPLGYGDMIPAFGIQQLSHPMYACGFNSIDVNFFYGYYYPFSYFMQGYWPINFLDFYSFPFTYGNNGIWGTTQTRYLYSDRPDNPDGWSMHALDYLPGDMNSMSSITPVELAHGDTLCTEFALLFAPAEVPNDPLHALNKLFLNAEILRAMYPSLSNGEECIAYRWEPWNAPDADGITFLPYPNPASDVVYLHTGPFHDTELIVELRDMTGQLVARSTYEGILENQTLSFPLPALARSQYVLSGLVDGHVFSKQIQVW